MDSKKILVLVLSHLFVLPMASLGGALLFLNYSDSAYGVHVPYSNIAVTFTQDSYNTDVTTGLHEMGHSFWYNEMNVSQRERFEELHNDNNSFFVREYGRTNVREDFATMFDYSSICKPYLYNESLGWGEKYEYFNNLLLTSGYVENVDITYEDKGLMKIPSKNTSREGDVNG